MSRKYVGPVVVALLGSLLAEVGLAQIPAPPAVAPTAPGKPADAAGGRPSPPAGPLAPLAWIHGCWEGNVNQRAFREEWLPLVGDTMVGVSQTTLRGKTVDFEYLRLEPRPDGVFYVAAPSGKNEAAFRLESQTTVEGAEVFTFANAARGVEYPQRIIYRRGSEGWLYATVEGKVKGVDKQVIFPMRRVDCQTGAIAGN
jgi:hypothetical protein